MHSPEQYQWSQEGHACLGSAPTDVGECSACPISSTLLDSSSKLLSLQVTALNSFQVALQQSGGPLGSCMRLPVQGPRMVRDVFRLAKENAPAIIFIDEVDAIATARFDAQTGADRSAFCPQYPFSLGSCLFTAEGKCPRHHGLPAQWELSLMGMQVFLFEI